MERLTQKYKGNYCVNVTMGDAGMTYHPGGKIVQRYEGSIIDRLAAYEDSSMTPDRVMELAAAEREGRLVVLPCAGNALYFEVDWESNEIIDRRFSSAIDVLRFGSRIGQRIFLTRAEAEATLAENGGG